jgi:hypothetical protein
VTYRPRTWYQRFFGNWMSVRYVKRPPCRKFVSYGGRGRAGAPWPTASRSARSSGGGGAFDQARQQRQRKVQGLSQRRTCRGILGQGASAQATSSLAGLGTNVLTLTPARALINYEVLTVIWGLAFASELAAPFQVNLALRLGHRPPRVVRHVNAFVETSIPTLALALGIAAGSPAYMLAQPTTWGYFLFVILAP